MKTQFSFLAALTFFVSSGAALASSFEAFSDGGIYRHGDRVTHNGKKYTMTVIYKGQSAPQYTNAGRMCRPETCTQAKPLGNDTIQVYWAPDVGVPPFSDGEIYRHGEKAHLNGKTYTMTVIYKGQPAPQYTNAGRMCRPEACTKAKPLGNDTIQVYWAPATP
jgi:hypothetical protein